MVSQMFDYKCDICDRDIPKGTLHYDRYVDNTTGTYKNSVEAYQLATNQYHVEIVCERCEHNGARHD